MSTTIRLLASLVLMATLVAPALAQGVDPASPDLLAYRLTPDAVAKLRQVMAAMDGYRPPSPDAVRSDIAVVTILAMNLPHGRAFSDAKVRETVTVLDRGHANLRETIKRAGMTSPDYVKAWMTLLVAHPAVVATKGGRAVSTGVAPENLAFVDREWSVVDALMTDLHQRIEKSRAGK